MLDWQGEDDAQIGEMKFVIMRRGTDVVEQEYIPDPTFGDKKQILNLSTEHPEFIREFKGGDAFSIQFKKSEPQVIELNINLLKFIIQSPLDDNWASQNVG